MFLLRWRFDYFDGKASRWGMWSRPATRREDMAAYVSKVNLHRAVIEAKNIETREVFTVAECAGADFQNFQWLSSARFSGVGNQLISQSVYGLRLISRNQFIEATVTGGLNIIDRTEEEKNFNYEAGL